MSNPTPHPGHSAPHQTLAQAMAGDMDQVDFLNISTSEVKEFFEQRLRYLQRGMFFAHLAQVLQDHPEIDPLWFDPGQPRVKGMVRTCRRQDQWLREVRAKSGPEYATHQAMAYMCDAIGVTDLRSLVLGEFASGPNQQIFSVDRETLLDQWRDLATKPDFGRSKAQVVAEGQQRRLEKDTGPAAGSAGRAPRL